jgi:hypothetical protein
MNVKRLIEYLSSSSSSVQRETNCYLNLSAWEYLECGINYAMTTIEAGRFGKLNDEN